MNFPEQESEIHSCIADPEQNISVVLTTGASYDYVPGHEAHESSSFAIGLVLDHARKSLSFFGSVPDNLAIALSLSNLSVFTN